MLENTLSDIASNSRPATKATFGDWLVLAKPGIVALVIVSALGGLYLGGATSADTVLILFTLSGLAITTAGSAILNNYIDRDIDKLMPRTAKRGLAAGIVKPKQALIVGLTFVLSGAALHVAFVNNLTAVATLVAAFGYVVVYTLWMKRTTPWANQVGGIAGAMPPLIGFIAASNAVTVEAMILFLIVALWQQPHALSLALKYRDQYADAKVPVIPVAKGVPATKLRILLYTIILLPVSLMPYYASMAGTIYLWSAIVTGIIFLFMAANFYRSEEKCNMKLFFYSIIYLTIIFTAMVVDAV